MRQKTYRVSRERAITIAANHNCVSKETAAKYTDSELKEVLRQLRLKPAFWAMIDRGIIEAAYLTGFEPSAEDLTEAALFEEAQAYLTNISIQF